MPASRNCMFLTGMLGVMAAMASSAQEAQKSDRDLYIGISAGHAKLDSDTRQAKRGNGFEMLLGWQVAERWNLELSSSYFNFETGDGAVNDFYRSAIDVNLMWVSHLGGWTPYAVAGIGGAYNDVFPNDDDGVSVTANAGVGVMSPALGPYGLRLRADTRLVYDQRAGGPKDLHAMLGVVIPLRRTPEPVIRTQIRTVEVIREIVREVPAPLPPAPPPAAAPIQPPPDSDRDGVDDSQDRCPNTLPRTQVDREGCAVEQAVVVLQGVHFETGSARLTHDSLSILVQAGAALHGQPSMKIEVRGHTDSVGKDASNQLLSERRAESVVDFLVESGVPRSRLTAVGLGETRPVADNGTPEGRASNRRVEFRVLAR